MKSIAELSGTVFLLNSWEPLATRPVFLFGLDSQNREFWLAESDRPNTVVIKVR